MTLKPIKGRANPSQYHGTLKNTICNKCGKNLNNYSREEQDLHEIECLKQKTLFNNL